MPASQSADGSHLGRLTSCPAPLPLHCPAQQQVGVGRVLITVTRHPHRNSASRFHGDPDGLKRLLRPIAFCCYGFGGGPWSSRKGRPRGGWVAVSGLGPHAGGQPVQGGGMGFTSRFQGHTGSRLPSENRKITAPKYTPTRGPAHYPASALSLQSSAETLAQLAGVTTSCRHFL